MLTISYNKLTYYNLGKRRGTFPNTLNKQSIAECQESNKNILSNEK